MITCALVLVMLAVGLFFSAFFSGAETGLYCLNRVRLHLGVKAGEADAVRLARLLQDEPGTLSITLIGTNVMNYMTTAAVAFLFADFFGFNEIETELYTVVALTPVVFVFGEVVPKSLFQLHPDELMMRSARLLAGAGHLFRATGVVWGLKLLARIVHRLLGYGSGEETVAAPKRRIASLLQEALAGHALADDHADLIDRVCGLSERPLHAVMVPRNRVRVVAAQADRRQLQRLARRTRHARLPVYDTHPRHIIGVAKVDELFRREDWTTVGDHLHPVMALSPHDTVAVATTRMQAKGRKIAIVADRGGQMLGLVTLEDLLEEVVGELAANV